MKKNVIYPKIDKNSFCFKCGSRQILNIGLWHKKCISCSQEYKFGSSQRKVIK